MFVVRLGRLTTLWRLSSEAFSSLAQVKWVTTLVHGSCPRPSYSCVHKSLVYLLSQRYLLVDYFDGTTSRKTSYLRLKTWTPPYTRPLVPTSLLPTSSYNFPCLCLFSFDIIPTGRPSEPTLFPELVSPTLRTPTSSHPSTILSSNPLNMSYVTRCSDTGVRVLTVLL